MKIVLIGTLGILFIHSLVGLSISLTDENKKQFIVYYCLMNMWLFGMSLAIIDIFSHHLVAILVLAILFVLIQAKIWHSFYMNFIFYPSQFKEN